MDISNRIKNFFAGGNRARNAASQAPMGADFLRYGNRGFGITPSTWSTVEMSDLDFYSGYSYAAINNRANKVSQLATGNLKTKATQKILDDARKKDIDIIHPYLTLIDESKEFTNSAFWYDISTYLDLEGVYYLMAVRAVAPNMVGEILYFKMLNPYNIRRVVNRETLEVGGYIENRDGFQREIPKEMIIEIRKLNPFSHDKTFSMTDAAKEFQFTMKQASDFTRSALRNNTGSPGIISTDVIMEDELFANFKARVLSQEKGAPLFGNGAGTINWTPMNVDLDKSALSDINSINRDTLFAVSGVSKTTMGIEESGTTREVSRTQKDKFMEDHVMPQLQLVIDAFNQDYKNYYPNEYKKNKYVLVIDSPMAADKDAEKKDVEIAQAAFDLYNDLIAAGYDVVLAAKYAEGKITLAELGEPKNPPKTEEPKEDEGEEEEPTLKEIEDTPPSKKKENKHRYEIDGQYLFNYEPDYGDCGDDCEICNTKEKEQEVELKRAVNELGSVVSNNVRSQEASLQNAVTNVEAQVVSSFLKNITKATNAFDKESDVMTKEERSTFKDELALAFAAYYLTLFPIYGNQLMRKRASEHGTLVSFQMTDEVKKLVESVSLSAAESHLNTVAKDILTSANKAYQAASERELAKLIASGEKESDSVIKLARKRALEGANQQAIVSAIQKEFQDMSKTRAKTIARNEAQRAFTQSQFQADIQFLNSTGLMKNAYKKWDAPNPDACTYCRSLAGMPPVPFSQNFVDLGGEITSTETRGDGVTVVKKMPVNYEAISAGGAHVNCNCRYILIIK